MKKPKPRPSSLRVRIEKLEREARAWEQQARELRILANKPVEIPAALADLVRAELNSDFKEAEYLHRNAKALLGTMQDLAKQLDLRVRKPKKKKKKHK